MFLAATDLSEKGEEKQVAVLLILNLIGDDGLDLFNTFYTHLLLSKKEYNF